MKKKKVNLIFTKNRPVLSPSKARHWKKLLEKTLKLGYEFEFNLPEPTGVCDGNSLMCPCTNPKKEIEKCYAECIKDKNECSLISKPEDCPGIFCIEFSSPCPSCADVQHDCNACTFLKDTKKNPTNIRKKVKRALKPEHNLLRAQGVFEITTDGSLAGEDGIELSTVGRRVDFTAFRNQAKKIIDECITRGAYVNERTSIHMHLLVGYHNLQYSNNRISSSYVKKHSNNQGIELTELEEPMPEIILANFHQLVRRYHNALTWITSSGNKYEHLTRWAKFRRPIINYSAINSNMVHIKDSMASNIASNGKYAFVNYYYTQFNKENNIKRLHLEARFADGNMSPTAVAAFGILLNTLMLKAASISVYGVVHLGDQQYNAEQTNIMKNLLNNTGNYDGPRTSDTSMLKPIHPALVNQSLEMLRLLRPELHKYGTAYAVLESLATQPCSIRRCNGDNWQKIENDLQTLSTEVTGELEEKILFAVDTAYSYGCSAISEWVAEVSDDMNLDKSETQTALEKLIHNKYIMWDTTVGTFIRI